MDRAAADALAARLDAALATAFDDKDGGLAAVEASMAANPGSQVPLRARLRLMLHLADIDQQSLTNAGIVAATAARALVADHFYHSVTLWDVAVLDSVFRSLCAALLTGPVIHRDADVMARPYALANLHARLTHFAPLSAALAAPLSALASERALFPNFGVATPAEEWATALRGRLLSEAALRAIEPLLTQPPIDAGRGSCGGELRRLLALPPAERAAAAAAAAGPPTAPGAGAQPLPGGAAAAAAPLCPDSPQLLSSAESLASFHALHARALGASKDGRYALAAVLYVECADAATRLFGYESLVAASLRADWFISHCSLPYVHGAGYEHYSPAWEILHRAVWPVVVTRARVGSLLPGACRPEEEAFAAGNDQTADSLGGRAVPATADLAPKAACFGYATAMRAAFNTLFLLRFPLWTPANLAAGESFVLAVVDLIPATENVLVDVPSEVDFVNALLQGEIFRLKGAGPVGRFASGPAYFDALLAQLRSPEVAGVLRSRGVEPVGLLAAGADLPPPPPQQKQPPPQQQRAAPPPRRGGGRGAARGGAATAALPQLSTEEEAARVAAADAAMASLLREEEAEAAAKAGKAAAMARRKAAVKPAARAAAAALQPPPPTAAAAAPPAVAPAAVLPAAAPAAPRRPAAAPTQPPPAAPAAPAPTPTPVARAPPPPPPLTTPPPSLPLPPPPAVPPASPAAPALVTLLAPSSFAPPAGVADTVDSLRLRLAAMHTAAREAEAGRAEAERRLWAAEASRAVELAAARAAAEESAEERHACVVCLEQPRAAALLPCRHACVCAPCAERLLAPGRALCPVCRAPVADCLRLFV